MSIAPATPSPTNGMPAIRRRNSGLASGRRAPRPEPRGGLPSNLHVAAIEHAPDAVIVVDLDGTILYVNPAFERSTGRHHSDAVGTNVHRLPAAEQPSSSIEALWATLRRGEVWAGEFVFGDPMARSPTPTHEWPRFGMPPGRAVSVSRDTTGLRALETRLEEYLRERASVAAALGAMHSGVAAEAVDALVGSRRSRRFRAQLPRGLRGPLNRTR